MKWPHALLILLVIVLCLMGQPRIAAIPASPLTLEVNPADPQASDAVTPFRTIAAALAWAQAHDRPTDIYIHGGIYREALGTIHHRQMPLRLVAQAGERVIVRGSQQWSDWQEVSSTPRFTIYRHPWTLAWGFSGNPWTNYGIELPLVAQRGELVWWRDTPLRQRLSFRELQGDDFYVDDTEQQLYVALSVGISPSELEVAVHREALRILDSGFISLVVYALSTMAAHLAKRCALNAAMTLRLKTVLFGAIIGAASKVIRAIACGWNEHSFCKMAGGAWRGFICGTSQCSRCSFKGIIGGGHGQAFTIGMRGISTFICAAPSSIATARLRIKRPVCGLILIIKTLRFGDRNFSAMPLSVFSSRRAHNQ